MFKSIDFLCFQQKNLQSTLRERIRKKCFDRYSSIWALWDWITHSVLHQLCPERCTTSWCLLYWYVILLWSVNVDVNQLYDDLYWDFSGECTFAQVHPSGRTNRRNHRLLLQGEFLDWIIIDRYSRESKQNASFSFLLLGSYLRSCSRHDTLPLFVLVFVSFKFACTVTANEKSRQSKIWF